MRLSNIILVLTGMLMIFSKSAHTEFVPPPNTSAGVIEKEIEREYNGKEIAPEREMPLLEIDIPEEQLSMSDNETAFIKTIKLQGNDVLSSKVVNRIIAEYENRDLKMSEIKELCLRLQEKFIKSGYFLARVYPPPQEVKEGNLTLDVLEGRLGEVFIVGNKHYKEKFLKKQFARFEGKAINYDELLKTLFLLNENSDLQVGAVFKKGTEVGTADLVLRVEDKLPCHLYIDENNYGSQQTSMWRTGARAEYGNLFTGGDRIAVTEVLGNPFSNLNYTNASYEIPLNTIGTRLKLNYIYSAFHVNQFLELNLRGRTQIGTVEVTQALARTRNWSTNLYLSFDYKQIQNYQMNVTSSYDKLRVFTLGFDFDTTDSWKGRNVADFSVAYGVPHFLGGLHTDPPKGESSREGSGGLFAILNVDYTRIQSVYKDTFFMFHTSGQATSYKLPLSEQIYIGGIDTVRGFPMAAALGDDGYYANLELRTPIPFVGEAKLPFVKRKKWREFIQLIGFVDQGGVLLNGDGENQKHHISMTGAGVGLRVFAPYGLALNFDVGFPLTEKKRESSPVYYFKASIKAF